MARGDSDDPRIDSVGNTREYNRIYNPEGEHRYTNLPENAQQVASRHFEQRLRSEQEELAAQLEEEASSRVQYWPNVGKFIIPRENTFSAHLRLVNGEVEGSELQFDAAKYKYFDAIIAQHAHRPDIFDPNHPDYPLYEGVRDNLAVLRNDIMGIYMDDGSFDPGDEKFVPALAGVAREIGNGIRYDQNAITRLFAPSLNVELLNMEGDGAAHAYKYVLSRQRDTGGLNDLVRDMRVLVNLPTRTFGLPVLEATAFSDDALDAAPPLDPVCMTHAQTEAYAYAILNAVENQQKPGTPLPEDAVHAMSDAHKTEAVMHGHTILDWLKKLQLLTADKTVEESVTSGTTEEKAELKQALEQAVKEFEDQKERLLKKEPQQQARESMREGERVTKVFRHMISVMAKLEMANSISDSMQISTAQTEALQEMHEDKDKSMGDMLDAMQRAMTDMSTAEQELQQEEQDQHYQQEREVADQATENWLSGKGRRRRRRRQQAPSVSAKRARKVDINIRADDYALGQGVFAGRGRAVETVPVASLSARQAQQQQQVQQMQPPPVQPGMEGLTQQQLDAVRMLGSTLAQNTQTANTLTPAQLALQQAQEAATNISNQVTGMTNASLNDKLTPDEVALTAQEQLKRERDQRREQRRNNRNNNNKGGAPM